MTVVIPCHKGDQHQAERLLKWIAEMGKVDAQCLLFCAKDCNHPYLLSLAQCAFTQAHWEEDRENIKCDWAKKIPGRLDASGPNSLFRQISMFFYLPVPKGPWLFLEPDAVPCRPDWYQLLKAEYATAVARGKPIMGFRVNSQTHPGSTPIPEHSSGVAIYPGNLPSICPAVWTCRKTAFDIAAAKEIVPQSHWTGLILDHYMGPSINSMQEADVRVPASVAIYHANKCGSLIPWLRQRLGMATGEPAPKLERVEVSTKPLPGQFGTIAGAIASLGAGEPVVDIYIKTCDKDYPWLEWCLKSIEKFSTGFRGVVIVTEGWSTSYKTPPNTRVISKQELKPGYLGQQSRKLGADQDSDADFILFMDSDCVFTKPVTPDDFIRDGKPIWLKTPFSNARDDQQVWKPVMSKFLGKEPQHEFMRRHPFILPRWAFTELRNFCRYKHGMELSDYIMAQAVPCQMLTFSEWNCAGFFLHEFHHDKVAWIDTTTDVVPDAVVWQGFTHAGEGRKQEDIAKFREILGADRTIALVDGDNLHFSPGSVTISKPGFQTTNDAIEFLVREARKAHVCKGRVLTALKKAGLVKGGKLMALPDDAPVVEMPKQPGVLLAIHSYPGANDCVARHWPYYYLSGATRIVGIGTTDGKCQWPVDCESANIGKNKYIDGPHLPQRLADTIEWCLTQPEDRFIIAEYDVMFLGAVPQWTGAMLHRTGGKLPDAKASQFMHNPWCLDRESGARLMHELRAIIQEGHCQSRWPEASPDVALGYAVDRLKLPFREMEHMFTRNSLEEAGALDLAIKAVRDGATIIHGCKTNHAFDALVGAHKATKRKKAA